MKNNMYKLASFAIAIVVATGLFWTQAQSASGTFKTIELTRGVAQTIELGGVVADVLVANPLVADVGTLRSSRLYVVGKAIGNTNILAFDAQGNQLADIAVQVRIDETSLQTMMKKFFPLEDIKVSTARHNIILTGTVSTPGEASRVRDLASRFIVVEGQEIVDLMQVAGEQQVMLKVKVIEAKRSVLREYGFDADFKPGDTDGDFFSAIAGTGLQSLAPFGTGQMVLRDSGSFGPLEIAIQGMERDGLVNTLAEPNLTAISGETAGFLAGGEFPVPTGRDQDGNITLEFRQFGVALNFTPTVLAKERISLHLSTEVSDKSDEDSVVIVNTQIPGLTVRRVETTVQMRSGSTLMIAGLIKSDDFHTLTGFPGLQDIPILGELFKSKSFSRAETELIILVTPYLVEPFAEKQAEEVTSSNKPVHLPSYPAVDIPVMKEDAASAMPEKQVSVKTEPRRVAANPLSQSFIDNLNAVYGSKISQKVTAGPAFGYIVD